MKNYIKTFKKNYINKPNLTFASLFFALCLPFLLRPFGTQALLSSSISLIALTLLLTFCLILNAKDVIKKNEIILMAILFITLLINVIKNGSFGVVLTTYNVFVILLLFNHLTFSSLQMKVVRATTVLFLVILFCSFTYEKLWGSLWIFDNGENINPNSYGVLWLILFFNLVCLIDLFLSEKRWIIWVYVGLAVGVMGILWASRCRSVMIAAFLFICLLFLKKVSYRKMLAIVIIVGIIFPFVYILLSKVMADVSFLGKNLFSGRENVWLGTLDIIKKAPLFGTGTSYMIDIGNGSITDSAHNIYLAFWRTVGLIPTAIIIYTFFHGKNVAYVDEKNRVAKMAFASCMVICMVETLLNDTNFNYLIMILLLTTQNDSIEKKTTIDTSIPKKIHYCWFGGKPLNPLGQKCLQTWKKFFPDYEIIEWNESNFDFNCCQYVKEAYEAKKWAFVSDYARYKILYEHGGVYFDTDVEVIKSFEDILAKGAFLGCENPPLSSRKVEEGQENAVLVASGLGCAAEPGCEFYLEILENYEKTSFWNEDGSMNLYTVVSRTTDLLRNHGLQDTDDIQTVAGITIYPAEYFCPINMDTGKLKITPNTYSIHRYAGSWVDGKDKLRGKIYHLLRRVGGEKLATFVRKIFGRRK